MAGYTRIYRTLPYRPLVLLFVLFVFLNFGKGADDVYSNSYISPNSAQDPHNNHNIEPGDRTSGPIEIKTETKIDSTIINTRNDNIENGNENKPRRVERSADPILSQKTLGADDLFAFKNIAETLDSNDVEYSGRIGHYIQPSRTVKEDRPVKLHQTEADAIFGKSGEGRGAPQGRSVLLSEPQDQIAPTATTQVGSAFPSIHLNQPARPRQANPDIQDIITGIVKLLNGNVNVQANTAPAMGRPLRPLSTRINNRGPPRISDVPALPPDFDVPSPPLPPPPAGQLAPPVSPTRMPTPYPFDLPPQNTSPIKTYANGVPLPEQIIPLGANKRPGFYRPVTIPPWQRPPHRRPPLHRRPIPNYKPLPLPRPAEDTISITSEKPMEDILNLDLGTHLQPPIEEHNRLNNSYPHEHHEVEDIIQEGSDEAVPDIVEEVEEEEHSTVPNLQEEIDKDDLEFEKNKEKTTSKMEKHTTNKVLEATSTIQDIENVSSEDPLPSAQETVITSSSELNSSNISPTETFSNVLHSTVYNESSASSSLSSFDLSNSSTTNVDATPVLESSIQDVLETLKDNLLSQMVGSSTPTEGLPSVLSSTSFSSSTTPTTQALASSSMTSSVSHSSYGNQSSQSFPYYPYRPRPGIVLDDTEYKPGGVHRPIITARPPLGQLGDIFDITVSAIQGPGGGSSAGQGKPYVIPVDIENVHLGSNADVITSPVGDEGFVSIDGKRTYLNLFGEQTNPAIIEPTKVAAVQPSTNAITGTGYATVEQEKPKPHGVVKPTQRRPVFGRRPSQPPVRIDTCIVGDDSTCDLSQNEICKTELGVSSCHCRPGHARRKHRDPCRKVVSVLVSLRVDRLYERRVVWANELLDRNSESFLQLSYEAERALESAMSMTPFSDEFLNAKVNSVYKGDRSAGQAGVFVNLTLQLEENADTSRPQIRGEIQRHLLGVIQRRSNNVGNSALWVDSPPGSVSNLQDLDECSSSDLHDCHVLAKCTNIFGGFKCECLDGYRDPWADNKHRAGRFCEQCSPQRCNNRGECKYKNGQEVCMCVGNYYGNQCELDGEVLGVAIGASVAAVIIIGLTLVCLVMWSRKWSREQKAAVGSPVFGYMAAASNTVKAPVVGGPPYQLTLEDRLRWAQIADVMAQSNHYAPEPVTGPTRPSSAMFGYPTLSLAGTLPHRPLHGTLPPVPLPRLNLQSQFGGRAASIHGMRPLDNSSSSDEEDKTDLLGRNFQVPRPKSRSNASIANQSGIYYDVDYEQNEPYKSQGLGSIPMSTYAIGRPQYYKN